VRTRITAEWVVGHEVGQHCLIEQGEVVYHDVHIIFVGHTFPGEVDVTHDHGGGTCFAKAICLRIAAAQRDNQGEAASCCLTCGCQEMIFLRSRQTGVIDIVAKTLRDALDKSLLLAAGHRFELACYRCRLHETGNHFRRVGMPQGCSMIIAR
jgi:hypothetical protein